MTCACRRQYANVPPLPPRHPVARPVGPGCCCLPHPHVHQTPTFMKRPPFPCGPWYFIPNQSPLFPTFGCCCPPPPRQKGPWEYIPSRLYPDFHHACACGCLGHHPFFVPNEPWFPAPVMFPTYQCAPDHGCLPVKCYSCMPLPPHYRRFP